MKCLNVFRYLSFIFFVCLCLFLGACQEVPADNPFDPEAPAVQQAPGQISGVVVSERVGLSLEGATVRLLGTSVSAIVECAAREEDEGCGRALSV